MKINISNIVENFIVNKEVINSNIFFDGVSVNKSLNSGNRESLYSFYNKNCCFNDNDFIDYIIINHKDIEDIYFENSYLSNLDIDKIYSQKYTKLNELGFNNINNNYFINNLVKFLNQNDCVQELIFRNNDLGDENLKNLGKINFNNINLVFLNSNNITALGIEYLYDFIGSLTKLEKFSLYNNNIGNKLKTIFPYLSKKLIYLDLGYTGIDDSILEELLLYIENNNILEELYIDGNNFSDDSINKILEKLDNKKGFNKINISDIGIDIPKKYSFHIVNGLNKPNFNKQRDIFVFGNGLKGKKDFEEGSIYYINKNSEKLIQDTFENLSIKRICFTSLTSKEYILSTKILKNPNLSVLTYKNVDISEDDFIKNLYINVKNNKGIFEIRFYENMNITEKGILFMLTKFPKNIRYFYFNDDIMYNIKNKNILSMMFLDERVNFDKKYDLIYGNKDNA